MLNHDGIYFNPLSANRIKWSNTLKQFVFDHFVGLALKQLKYKNDLSDMRKE